MSTANRAGRYRPVFQRVWRSLLLNRILLALAVLASAAATVILGLIVNLFIAGYSGGSNPTSVAGLAFPIAMLLYVIAGVPALLICALLWLAYTASRGARARAHAEPDGPPSPRP